jgi:hypothetical protein
MKIKLYSSHLLVYYIFKIPEGGFVMARSKYRWDEKKYNRYLKDKRGGGEGQNYQPWIRVQDIPSKGWSTKSLGWKTERIQHFLSKNELYYFYLLEWSNSVIDIREQYPLLDLDETVRIAENLGIRHPKDTKSGFHYVLTTDFLITFHDGDQETVIARTVKPANDLDKPRVIEKLEIERRYWGARGIDWGIVTEKEIPLVMARNIGWIHSAYKLQPLREIDITSLLDVASVLKERLRQSDELVKKTLMMLDDEAHLEKGTALSILKHLIAIKQVSVDMGKQININQITIDRVAMDDDNGGVVA